MNKSRSAKNREKELRADYELLKSKYEELFRQYRELTAAYKILQRCIKSACLTHGEVTYKNYIVYSHSDGELDEMQLVLSNDPENEQIVIKVIPSNTGDDNGK